MSIELIGPKKYKFQDQACTLLAILAVSDTTASLQIEPQDGEDALLTLNKGGQVHIVEIQVKGSKEKVTPARLADWLSHFPNRQANDSLLERLISHVQRSVLFIVSGRCNDATVAHVVAPAVGTVSLNPNLITKDIEIGMRVALQDYAGVTLSTDKALAKKRRIHIGAKLPLISVTKLRDVLQRVLIFEQLESDEALTRTIVPARIETLLLPSDLRLNAPPKEVISRLHPPLLNACLNVFIGNHPVIYYVGAHGARSLEWKSIVREIVWQPSHIMFEDCWEWLITMESPNYLAEVVAGLGVNHSERLACLLLERKQRTSGEFLPEVWEALFELPVGDEVKSDWIRRMAEISPNALNSLGEYERWVPKGFHDEFLGRFREDIDIVTQIREISAQLNKFVDSKRISNETSLLVTSHFQSLIEQAPPRHWATYDLMLSFLRSFDFGHVELINNIKRERSKAIELAHIRRSRKLLPLEEWEGMS